MAAEAIAKVVADLRAGRIRDVYFPEPGDEVHVAAMNAYARRLAAHSDAPVVDATAIYDSLVAKDDPVYLYEDHPCIAPPWPVATIAYQNEHGNVITMTLNSAECQGLPEAERWGVESQPGPWEPAHPVEWQRVRWLTDAFAFVGGRGGRGPTPTSGPVHCWRFAIYDDGEPADLHWVQLVPDYPMERWDMAHLVLLGALNFVNCRNVDLVEPRRPNAERKRILRTGVRVHEINVFPTGKSVRSAAGDRQGGTPLTSVRGHFACYGEQYGRGLLFGKYSGRFWIPQHARGEREHGEIEHDYKLHPETA